MLWCWRFLRPKGRLEINSLRLLMLFRAIRGGANGFVWMDAAQKAAAIRELATKVNEDSEYWTGYHGMLY